MAVVEVKGVLSAAGRRASDLDDLDGLYGQIREFEANLVGSDGRTRALPLELSAFLRDTLGDLKAGRSVTILQENAELTTAEAAKLLSVSRQFLIQLLEQRKIDFHMVGTHRRVYERDLLAYRTKRDTERRKILDELARAEMDEGIYGRVEFGNDDSG